MISGMQKPYKRQRSYNRWAGSQAPQGILLMLLQVQAGAGNGGVLPPPFSFVGWAAAIQSLNLQRRKRQDASAALSDER